MYIVFVDAFILFHIMHICDHPTMVSCFTLRANKAIPTSRYMCSLVLFMFQIHTHQNRMWWVVGFFVAGGVFIYIFIYFIFLKNKFWCFFIE